MLIKVCGITNAEDLRVAVDAGAGALGFIFHPPSPRSVWPQDYLRLAELVPAGIFKVGVFVGAPLELAGLDAVQVYGDAASTLPVWRAYRVTTALPELDPMAAAVLLDGAANGISYDWRMLRGLPARVIIAGGLDASNVGEAIAAARPWGVDACSSMEAVPGRKDPEKVRAFVKAAAGAFRSVDP